MGFQFQSFSGKTKAIENIVREKLFIMFTCRNKSLISEWESTGRHLFNLNSLRVLVFVAVKEKACNFLAAFLNSPAASPVLQHYSEKLMSFLKYKKKSENLAGDSSSVLVLDMCEK